MFQLLLADGSRFWSLDLWYAVPAILAVSLVYAATRQERMRPILIHAGRVALWIVVFMCLVFAVLELISWRTKYSVSCALICSTAALGCANCSTQPRAAVLHGIIASSLRP
jgi:hypothetical protein